MNQPHGYHRGRDRDTRPVSVEQQLARLHRRLSLLMGLSAGTVIALIGWFLWIGRC